MTTQHTVRRPGRHTSSETVTAQPLRGTATAGPVPLITLLAGVFVVVLDFFIVNVALPSMQHDLHTDDTGIEWVIAGFGLTYGGLLLAGARAGDRWGRRRIFATGVLLFTLASAACGLAPSIGTLTGARIAQGIGGALITPMVLALIGDIYTGPARARAIGAYSTAMGIAAASGQLIGGALIQLDLLGVGWRSIFLVNVPIGVAILALVRRLPGTRADHPPKLDVAEMALSVAALTTLLLPLLEGRRLGWPSWTWACLAASVLCTALLVVRCRVLLRRADDPMLGAVLRGSPAVRNGLIMQVALFLGMASYFLVLAVYLQGGRGLSALGSGAMFTFLAVAYLVGTAQAERLVARFGRRAVAVGAATSLLGHLATAFVVVDLPAAGVLWLAPGLVLTGLGMGVSLTSQIAAIMSSVQPAEAGSLSGTLSAVQQVGNTVGVALIGIVFFGAMDRGPRVALEHGLAYLVAVTALLGLLAMLPAQIRRR
ncbi:MFS transporter [Flexivirga oryzae]|uniref:MFS family permease n=1 Tax=Flexivirga oryzae TaxID=1794944 RepID=A0A839NAJ8_9MICO|nr:MFS transporter [Flexivirga oryzae]MBB2894247.1 MFS family permease [Flexivirga oryzae]